MSHRIAPLLLACACAAGLVGSGCERRSPTTNPEAASDDAGGSPEAATAHDDGPVVAMTEGVPHTSPITGIAIDPTGKAALTRDSSGGLRFWAALDGTKAPSVVPVRDIMRMSLAARPDEDGKGWDLAVVDASHGLRLLQVDAKGRVQSRAQTPPTEGVLVAEVLGGGRGVLTIGMDHELRLLDREGRVKLQRVERGFRAEDLRVTSDGKVVVLSQPKVEADGMHVEARALNVGDDALAYTGDPIEIVSTAIPGRNTVALSPDARTLVYVHRQGQGAAWHVKAAQLDGGPTVSVSTENHSAIPPRVILLSGGRVLVEFGTASATELDLAKRTRKPRSLRGHQSTVGEMVAVGATRRLTAHGVWLGVHDVENDESIYLGYAPLAANNGAISPSGERVAYAMGVYLVLDDMTHGSEGVRRLPVLGGAAGLQVVHFVDDDHLIVGSWEGELAKVRFEDGEVVDRIDAGGSLNLATLGPGGDLLVVRITELFNEPMVIELEDGPDGGFGARHLIADGSMHMGAYGEGDGRNVWTVDGNGRYRSYALQELREGVDRQSMKKMGKPFAKGRADLVVTGPKGKRFTYNNDTTGQARGLLRRLDAEGKPEREATIPGFITRLEASPDGRAIAVLTTSGTQQLVTVVDAQTLETSWSRAHDAVVQMAWSRGGKRLLVVSNQTGSLVLDSRTGDPVHRRCSLEFQKRGAPSVNSGFATRPNVCEL